MLKIKPSHVHSFIQIVNQYKAKWSVKVEIYCMVLLWHEKSRVCSSWSYTGNITINHRYKDIKLAGNRISSPREFVSHFTSCQSGKYISIMHYGKKWGWFTFVYAAWWVPAANVKVGGTTEYISLETLLWN